VLATTAAGALGTWTVTFLLPVGVQALTAKQTVNQLPHVGLTSAASNTVYVTVYPDAPAITSASTPAVTTTTSPVTLTGRGDAGDTITLYDGSQSIGTVLIGGAGTWTLTVNLAVGTHSLSAVQTS